MSYYQKELVGLAMTISLPKISVKNFFVFFKYNVLFLKRHKKTCLQIIMVPCFEKKVNVEKQPFYSEKLWFVSICHPCFSTMTDLIIIMKKHRKIF